MASVELDLRSIILLVHSVLAEHRYVGTLRALEQESGVLPSLGSEDLDFVRTLILDGRWDDLENVVAPLYQQPSGSFDASGVLFHLRKQRFLELFAGGLRGTDDSDEGSVVMALVAALRSVKDVSNDPQAFNSLCYCLTLGSVTEHPDFGDWTPFWGRQLAWLTVKADFERLFPRLGSGSSQHAIEDGYLPRLLARAGAAVVISQVAADINSSPPPSAVHFDLLKCRVHELDTAIPGPENSLSGAVSWWACDEPPAVSLISLPKRTEDAGVGSPDATATDRGLSATLSQVRRQQEQQNAATSRFVSTASRVSRASSAVLASPQMTKNDSATIDDRLQRSITALSLRASLGGTQRPGTAMRGGAPMLEDSEIAAVRDLLAVGARMPSPSRQRESTVSLPGAAYTAPVEEGARGWLRQSEQQRPGSGQRIAAPPPAAAAAAVGVRRAPGPGPQSNGSQLSAHGGALGDDGAFSVATLRRPTGRRSMVPATESGAAPMPASSSDDVSLLGAPIAGGEGLRQKRRSGIAWEITTEGTPSIPFGPDGRLLTDSRPAVPPQHPENGRSGTDTASASLHVQSRPSTANSHSLVHQGLPDLQTQPPQPEASFSSGLLHARLFNVGLGADSDHSTALASRNGFDGLSSAPGVSGVSRAMPSLRDDAQAGFAASLAPSPSRLSLGRSSSANVLPSVAMVPCAILRDSQPLRALAFDPAASLWIGDSARNRDRSVALAVGSNNHSLRVVRVSWELPPPPSFTVPTVSPGGSNDAIVVDAETGLPQLTNIHTWSGHHNGSVYAASWAYADAGCTNGLLASCSNDTKVLVSRWRHYDGGGRDVGGPALGATALSLSPAAATVRDVCWVGISSAAALPPMLIAAGGGDFGVSAFDISSSWAAWPAAGGVGPVRGGSLSHAAARGPAPLIRFLGHADTVHAVAPWSEDGRAVMSASADGTLRLWDVRAGQESVMVLNLSGSAGIAPSQLDAPGRHLSRFRAQGSNGVELHSLAVRPAAGGSGDAPREVVVGTADGCVAVVDVAAGRMVCHARVHGLSEVRSVAVLGPLVLSAAFDGAVAISRHGGPGSFPDRLDVLAVRSDHRDKVLCARWHPADVAAFAHYGSLKDALAMTSSADRTALLWRVALRDV